MTLTLKENEKVCEVLMEMIREIELNGKALDEKYYALGDEQFNTKMMYLNQAIGIHDAAKVLINKHESLVKERFAESQKLQRS